MIDPREIWLEFVHVDQEQASVTKQVDFRVHMEPKRAARADVPAVWEIYHCRDLWESLRIRLAIVLSAVA